MLLWECASQVRARLLLLCYDALSRNGREVLGCVHTLSLYIHCLNLFDVATDRKPSSPLAVSSQAQCNYGDTPSNNMTFPETWHSAKQFLCPRIAHSSP